MLKSVEIRKNINNKVIVMNDLTNRGKVDEAYEVAQEIENLTKELDIALLAEKHENIDNKVVNEPKTVSTPIQAVNDDVDENTVFNKVLVKNLGGLNLDNRYKVLTENEEKYAFENIYSGVGQLGDVPEKGGYLLPKDQEQTILEFRKNLTSLRNFVRVKQVHARTGEYTKADDNKLKLVKFDEMETLSEADVTFTKADWKVANYGLLLPISNLLIRDLMHTNAKIVDYCGSEMAKASVRTENEEIFKCVKANIVNAKSTGSTLKDVNELADKIKTILNVDLASEYRTNAKIYTDEIGFAKLDEMKYADGRFMLQEDITVASGKKLFNKEIVIVEGCEDLFDTYSTDVQYFIGDMEEFITYREIQGTMVEMNDSIGFKNNVTWLKMTERFGTEAYNPLAMKFAEYTISKPKSK